MTRLAKLFATTSILVLGASSAFAMQDTVRNTSSSGASSVLAAAPTARNDARFVDGYRVQPYSAQERLLADRLSGGININ